MSLREVIAERTAKKPKKLRTVTRAGVRGHNGANGNGNTENLSRLLAPYLPAAVRAWVAGLKATICAYDRTAQKTIDTGLPDHRVRADCALRIVEYDVGRAIERSMALTGNYKELSELVQELKSSPEAQRLIAGGFFDQLLRQDSPEQSVAVSEGKKESHEEEIIVLPTQKTG